jgi:hypothetical protein
MVMSASGSTAGVAAGVKARPSQPALSREVEELRDELRDELRKELHGGLGDEARDELRNDADLPTDITQPMEAPSAPAAPLSGEHPEQARPAEPARRVWWAAGAALGAAVLLLGVAGWLAHERSRLSDELSRKQPDREAVDRERRRLEDELVDVKNRNDQACKQQIDDATKQCNLSLKSARDEGVTKLEDADRKLEDLRGRLATAVSSSQESEQRLRALVEAQKQESGTRLQLDTENKQLHLELDRRLELLKVLCKDLQSAGKHRKECTGI